MTKRAFPLLAVAGLLLFMGTSPLQATPAGFILNFDENCNGTVSTNGGGTFTAATCSFLSDPTPGGVAGNVVTYFLPNLVFTGDVGILEFGGSELSDVLSFTNASGDLSGNQVGDRMIFYSLLGDDNGGDLADTGFPSIQITSDVATEDINGNFTWSPSPNTYNGISPEIPEPASLMLFGSGLLGLATAIRKRRAS